MSIQDYRLAIASAYPDGKWGKKVEAMSDRQVIAIYNRFIRDGVFNLIRTPRKVKKKPSTSDSNEFRQQTLWDDYGFKR